MRRIVPIAVFWIAMGMTPAVAAPSPLSPTLRQTLAQADPALSIPVILEFRNGPVVKPVRGLTRKARRRLIVQQLRERATPHHATLKSWFARNGIPEGRLLWASNRYAVRLTAGQIEALAAQSLVEAIRDDVILHAPISQPATVYAPEWNLTAIRAPDVWAAGYTGQGIVVAGLDTGVDAVHPDLGSRWRGGSNSWYDPYGQHALPHDANGHGTQTMSVMVGGTAGGTAIGVAPGAQWISARIFDDNDLGTYSAIHSALQWLLDPDGDPLTDDAPDVVNNSWGVGSGGNCDTEFLADIQALRAADIAVVFSAGNNGAGSGTTVSPANNPGAYAAGASDSSNHVTATSSRGPSACDQGTDPDLAAPGQAIYVADLSLAGQATYVTVSGTSFSAPHVAGAMALLRSAFPSLTPDELESRLNGTALDIGIMGADNDSGHGLLDVGAAYTQLDQAAPDTDADGVPDYRDNCTGRANAGQQDTSGDGYGNACDGDLNDNGQTTVVDMNKVKAALYKTPGQPGYSTDADFNGDGVQNIVDLNYFKAKLYGKPPGPSCCVP